MAKSNHIRVGEALEILRQGLQPFVERELEREYGEKWRQKTSEGFADNKEGNINWDSKLLLRVMWELWNTVFTKTLGHAERTLVSELRTVRNKWAHQEAFSGDDTYRALDSVERLLTAVSAPQAGELADQKTELLRVRFKEQQRQEIRKQSFKPTEGKPQGGLKPWRQVVTPHQDVVKGTYQQAEFAADLWQVFHGQAAPEYQDPQEFFRRTFITEGIHRLLANAIKRLSGQGGDPVVEMQTNFGGGKTHSMLALHHLFSGVNIAELPGLEDILKTFPSENLPKGVRRAVIVGTKISPGNPSRKSDGTVVKTLWGEIAWQLGGREGYEMVREDDERATSPGDKLRELFNRYSPCLILIDEWVAYARQLHEGSDLPAGSFDTQFTFTQALSESAKLADQCLLVVSIPASDNEIGGEWGQRALSRLKNAIGRLEASWRPASPDEGFEIVRRRLFEPITKKEDFVARDAVTRAFVEMYASQHGEFPSKCREGEYERRMQMAYPIHPELFDRLYNDWSSIDKFQRTRGVLRLMAAVIHSLWERQDGNLLILPATVPIDDPQVHSELTKYLDDNWMPVISKDVDGESSLPLNLDREVPNLGRYSASRRVARTIYMGSAPMQQAANRGIDDRHIKLGCVQPGEAVATFGDALRRLSSQATYLYQDSNRYWYSTQPTVNRLAMDRANQVHDHDALEEIVSWLRNETRSRGIFRRVHACVSGGDVPDEKEASLVILKPDCCFGRGREDNPARKEVQKILDQRGNQPRRYRNGLVFLAADETRLKDLVATARNLIAWRSISRDQETLNLDAHQRRLATIKYGEFETSIKLQIGETYQWLLVPVQSNPKVAMELQEIRVQGSDSLAVRAGKKLKSEELLLDELGAVRLRMELDRVPLWRGDDVEIRQLVEDFATYTYLPRITDSEVLLSAIREGVSSLNFEQTFAFAEGKDTETGKYLNLAVSKSVRVLTSGGACLVKPEVAQEQTKKEETQQGPEISDAVPQPGEVHEPPPEPPKRVLRRFFGSVSLDSLRLGGQAGKIGEEVVVHLINQTGADVKITMEIEARLPEGADEKLIRDITENCRTLNFTQHEFEEE